jgi:serine/threonine-protein kinase
VSPFLAETPATVMHKVLQKEPERPSVLVAALPPGFDGVVARALAKKVEERFQTAREFQAALLQALQGKTVSATAAARKPEPAQRTATAARAPALSIPPEALAEIERSLSRHVGPLARLLIKRSQGEAASIEEFFRALADNIPNDEEQRAFMKKMATVKTGAGHAATVPNAPAASKPAAGGAKTALTPEALAIAEKRLASYVGPLARVLIKEAAGKSGNLKELYAQLADHIDSEDERRDFLASLPR